MCICPRTAANGLDGLDSDMISDCRLLSPRHFLHCRADEYTMTKAAVEPKNFEAAMAELDALVEKMENGELALEASLSAYQRGTELLKYCETVLADAQQRIQVLEGDNLKEFKA
jgi:exodeoxyribonuclease VII small subunit